MKKIILFVAVLLATSMQFYAQEFDEKAIDSIFKEWEKIEASMKYETGKIQLGKGNGTLTVPKKFKFLNAEQTQYVLHDLWENPEDTNILGALLPEDLGVTNPDCWMFVISYEEIGYVNDDDANDINYDDLLADLKKDVAAENAEREKLGYGKAELIGWASKPYYDDKAKVLHWAKEFNFDGSDTNTLNYDLRVLGRKGMYNVSAVAMMEQLDVVKSSIPEIITSIQYNEGSKYSDFDSSVDEVAAWTIGGLVAGKVIAKTGLLAILAKFGKFIFIGLLGLLGIGKKFLFGKKDQVVSKNQDEPKENSDSADVAEKEN